MTAVRRMDPVTRTFESTAQQWAMYFYLDRYFQFSDFHNQDSSRLRYWRGSFYEYEDGCYRVLPLDDLKTRLIQFLHSPGYKFTELPCQNITRHLLGDILENLKYTSRLMVSSGRDLPCWLVEEDEIPIPGLVLVMADGLLSLDEALAGDQEPLHPFSANYFTTIKLPYAYDRQAACPKWLRFLQDIFPGETADGATLDERIALLQEWFGYCLTADTRLHEFLLAVGPGANGKSVVFGVLTELLGRENVSHVPLEMFGDRFALGDTIGKLANVVSEIGALDRFDEGRLKAFVSGDRITVDRKYKEPVSVQPTARLMLATNTPPRVSDRSQGLWRRLLYLPFEVTIPPEQQNPKLTDELLEELSGIFNWSLAGLKRLRDQGRFTEPKSSRQGLQDYRVDCDPVRAFLTEHYEVAAGSAIATKDVYAHYTRWCTENGYQPMNSRNFGKNLRSVYPEVERKQVRYKEDRSWLYCGIRLWE